MAVLGSTVDPRLGAVSPAAIQALSQAGAATGQMYANLGGSIAGVMKDAKSRRDDFILQDAFSKSIKYGDDGEIEFNKKSFYNETKGKKINSKVIDSFYKNKLESAVMETDMAIQKQLAGYKGEEVDLARAAESRLSVLQENQIELGNKELNLKAYEVLSNDYNRVAQLKLQRDQLAQNQEFKELDLGLLYKELDEKIKQADRAYVEKVADFAKDNALKQAQIKALDAETLFRQSQTAATEADLRAMEDLDIGLGSEETMNNKLVGVLGIADRSTAWDPLSNADKAAFIKNRMDFARQGGANMDSERMKDLQRSYDFFNEDALLKGISPTVEQTPPPLPETRLYQRAKEQAEQSIF